MKVDGQQSMHTEEMLLVHMAFGAGVSSLWAWRVGISQSEYNKSS